MKIKWMGHSCFLITSVHGLKILTDPFNEQVGYMLPNEEAHIVTTSHKHFDHCNISIVKGNYNHIDGVGIFKEQGIDIIGISTFHDNRKGLERGANVVYKFNIDGLRVCHSGDLGHVLTSQQVKEIGDVDILFLPVGGTYTIDYDKAHENMRLLNPKVTIPMHYKTPEINFSIDGVEKFLNTVGNVMKIKKQEIEIDRSTLADYLGVIVLDYK